MDFKLSCELFSIKVPFTHRCLKKAYYREALKYHPDKNKDKDAINRFQDIQNSFELLSKYLDENSNVLINEKKSINQDKSFINILKEHLNIDADILKMVSSNITNKFNVDIYDSILNIVDNKTAEKALNYCETYRDVLGIESSVLDKVKTVLKERRKNDEEIILNPNLDNILNMEVYCLRLEEEEICVPLWQEEVVFKVKDKTYIIKNDLDLPENILLDENNDLHIKIDISMNKNIDSPYIYKIGGKVFEIKYEELKIKLYQTHRIKKQGVPRINPNNIFDISNISDVIFHIYLII